MPKSEIELNLAWENLDDAFAELERECEDVVRGLTVEVWFQILNRTPQYWGRMVASYNYSLNVPITVDRSFMVEPQTEDEIAETPIKSRGRQEAVQLASFFATGKDLLFRLGDTVWITNGADHGEGAYAGQIEAGDIRLRSINMPGMPVARTLDSIQARYGRGITPARARELKARQITDY